ncbi:glycerate kinase isoform X2 [Folsomia candida]|uniref:glycerate kinase isoform X2 n=1 Tax=Folsomia candida TaxID=158441 RepID=UPI001604BC4F|nr:glycerate kinase isoform X2 [Folsomia candida]
MKPFWKDQLNWPYKFSTKRWRVDGDGKVTKIDLKNYNKVYVVGFGKAVLPMAEQVVAVLGDKLEKVMVNIPDGFRDPVEEGIQVHRGAKNNIPDEAAFQGSKEIVQLVQNMDHNDLLIVLITGGGSALFSYPLYPITVDELGSLVKTLSRGGATINELNTVRKRLSLVKGGGLLTLCKSSTIIGIVLSDVPEDPLDIIASGPTVPNKDPESRAREIIDKYSEPGTLAESIEQVLKNPIVTPPKSKNVTNIIIGNNTVALEAGSEAAKRLNLYPLIVTKTLSGNASEVGDLLGHATQAISYLFRAKQSDQFISAYASTIYNAAEKLSLEREKVDELVRVVQDPEIQSKFDGVCILFGGETTVNVVGKGIGGRNQELALSAGMKIDTCANNLHVKGKVALLSAGTDGYDGPCQAAGAVADSSMLQRGYDNHLSPSEYLRENNSYQYFKYNSNGAYHIITGHTETNVMDLVIIVIVK